MTSNSKQLIAWLHAIRTQASSGDLSPTLQAKHRAVTTGIIKSGENLNFAISAAKIAPACVDLPALTAACRQNAPAWLDALLLVPGVDKATLEADIIQRQHPLDALTRMEQWYATNNAFPAQSQQCWAERLHDLCKRESSSGTAYQRKLQSDTGEALTRAISLLGNKIDDPMAATWVLRAAHHVLRGMTRSTPVLHSLPADFAETTLEAMWDFAMNQTKNKDEWRINAQAFTLANSDAFPDARSWLLVNHPREAGVVERLWDKPALEVSAHFATERQRYGITATLVQREGSWVPPKTNSATSAAKELDFGFDREPSLS